MLNTLMSIAARGLSDWPSEFLKDSRPKQFAGKGNKHRMRKKRPNMNHVSRATKLKHRKAK